MDFTGFDRRLVRFLGQLKLNNNREWFARNKERYEAEVREPTRAFIRAIAPRIERINPCIVASDAKVGGSMMRPYRDTRFSPSKTPYKTNVGIQFRHGEGETAHAPGFWVHIEPGEFWLAVGMWRPESAPLSAVRRRIAEHPDDWIAARDHRRFRAAWQIVGDRLKRPPRGFDPEHPLIEDLKLREFLGFRDMGVKQLYRRDVVARVADAFAAARGYLQFLCDALGLP